MSTSSLQTVRTAPESGMKSIRKPAAPLRSEPGLQLPADLEEWRTEDRDHWLRRFAAGAAQLTWNQQLLAVLLDELWIDETFVDLVGEPSQLPETRYPEAVAVALLLRHSWRPDDLVQVSQKLGIGPMLAPPKTQSAKMKARSRL